MKDFKKELSGVADAAAKIMGEALKGQQHKIDKNKNNKIDSQDFAILRGQKKAPMKKEEVEQIDEVSLKTATSAYVKRVGKDLDKPMSDKTPKEVQTLQRIGKKHGVSGVARAVKAADKEHDLNDPVHNPRKSYVKSVMSTIKKEEVEQVDEASYSAKSARAGKDIGKPGKAFAMIAKKAGAKYGSEEAGKRVAGAVLKKLRMKEDMEITDELADIILEYESKNGVYKHKGTYGGEKGAEYGETDWDKEEKESKKMKEKPMKPGARQNYIRSTRVNEKPGMKKESFTGILNQYQEGGLKTLFESLQKEEKVLTEEVKEETIEVPVMDANEINGVKVETIEERTLTEPEAAKKEEIVMSMKKKMSGFKERYGDKAKSVMYATATKIAKKGS